MMKYFLCLFYFSLSYAGFEEDLEPFTLWKGFNKTDREQLNSANYIIARLQRINVFDDVTKTITPYEFLITSPTTLQQLSPSDQAIDALTLDARAYLISYFYNILLNLEHPIEPHLWELSRQDQVMSYEILNLLITHYTPHLLNNWKTIFEKEKSDFKIFLYLEFFFDTLLKNMWGRNITLPHNHTKVQINNFIINGIFSYFFKKKMAYLPLTENSHNKLKSFDEKLNNLMVEKKGILADIVTKIKHFEYTCKAAHRITKSILEQHNITLPSDCIPRYYFSPAEPHKSLTIEALLDYTMHQADQASFFESVDFQNLKKIEDLVKDSFLIGDFLKEKKAILLQDEAMMQDFSKSFWIVDELHALAFFRLKENYTHKTNKLKETLKKAYSGFLNSLAHESFKNEEPSSYTKAFLDHLGLLWLICRFPDPHATQNALKNDSDVLNEAIHHVEIKDFFYAKNYYQDILESMKFSLNTTDSAYKKFFYSQNKRCLFYIDFLKSFLKEKISQDLENINFLKEDKLFVKKDLSNIEAIAQKNFFTPATTYRVLTTEIAVRVFLQVIKDKSLSKELIEIFPKLSDILNDMSFLKKNHIQEHVMLDFLKNNALKKDLIIAWEKNKIFDKLNYILTYLPNFFDLKRNNLEIFLKSCIAFYVQSSIACAPDNLSLEPIVKNFLIMLKNIHKRSYHEENYMKFKICMDNAQQMMLREKKNEAILQSNQHSPKTLEGLKALHEKSMRESLNYLRDQVKNFLDATHKSNAFNISAQKSFSDFYESLQSIEGDFKHELYYKHSYVDALQSVKHYAKDFPPCYTSSLLDLDSLLSSSEEFIPWDLNHSTQEGKSWGRFFKNLNYKKPIFRPCGDVWEQLSYIL